MRDRIKTLLGRCTLLVARGITPGYGLFARCIAAYKRVGLRSADVSSPANPIPPKRKFRLPPRSPFDQKTIMLAARMGQRSIPGNSGPGGFPFSKGAP